MTETSLIPTALLDALREAAELSRQAENLPNEHYFLLRLREIAEEMVK